MDLKGLKLNKSATVLSQDCSQLLNFPSWVQESIGVIFCLKLLVKLYNFIKTAKINLRLIIYWVTLMKSTLKVIMLQWFVAEIIKIEKWLLCDILENLYFLILEFIEAKISMQNGFPNFRWRMFGVCNVANSKNSIKWKNSIAFVWQCHCLWKLLQV